MKFKVIDYVEKGYRTIQTGTCELCFGTGLQLEDVLIVEDDKGKVHSIELYMWDWGDLDNYEIDNLVDFSAWLQNKEFSDDIDEYDIEIAILNSIREYTWEKEDEEYE